MILHRPNTYAGAGLDRLSEKRIDAEWFAAVLADPATRFLPVWGAHNLVADGDEPNLAWLQGPAAAELLASGGQPTLLGRLDGALYVALDVSFLPHTDHEPALVGHGHFVDLRTIGPLLPRGPAALLATARAYVYWHGRHRHCGVCGQATLPEQSGHLRRCTNPACGTQHFPRTDPAVIMLVHDGRDRCVLGRQSVWPPGMHSVLAGFLEPGESLEDTVAREVKEEVGLTVTDIAYHSSQPWPFPSSLMLGFFARATGENLQVALDELETARWMTRAEILASPEDERFRLPRRDSIARALLTDWLEKTA